LAGRGQAGSFGIIVVTRLAAEASGQIAPAPRVRLGLSERLGRQPRAVHGGPARRTGLISGPAAVSGQATVARPAAVSRHGKPRPR
jgi:hypothetical protein